MFQRTNTNTSLKKHKEINANTDLSIILGEMPVVYMQYSTHKSNAKSGIQGMTNMNYGDYS